MSAVVVGAGKIGCGFAGQILAASGYETVFVARDPVLVDHLNRVRGYRVRLGDSKENLTVTVEGIRAVPASDFDRVVEEMSQAEVIITAVGAGNLPLIAPWIGRALGRRKTPLNVLAFENLTNAGYYLGLRVGALLPYHFDLHRHGFSGAVIPRAVTQRLGDPRSDDPLTFVGDAPATFMVERPSLRAPFPNLAGMVTVEDLNPWIQRKLYTYSAGHAVTAYLGFLKGYHYIHTAIRDPEIRADVLAAMAEGQQGLLARYGPEIAGPESDLLEIMARFENAALNDSLDRVGRDPQRKLGAQDRLVGAARLAQSAGVQPQKLALGAAAALLFDNPKDPSAEELQREIRTVGPVPALERISQLDPRSDLGHLVAEIWNQLAVGWQKGNLLLSLDRFQWAWR
jgi:mannitol-1-phosphate 5-dehydrogenase